MSCACQRTTCSACTGPLPGGGASCATRCRTNNPGESPGSVGRGEQAHDLRALANVTTGWGNEHSKDAVRRTIGGGPSGRFAIFVLVAAFFAVGLYEGSLLLSVAGGLATVAAGGVLVRASRSSSAVGRMKRRHVASQGRPGDHV